MTKRHRVLRPELCSNRGSPPCGMADQNNREQKGCRVELPDMRWVLWCGSYQGNNDCSMKSHSRHSNSGLYVMWDTAPYLRKCHLSFLSFTPHLSRSLHSVGGVSVLGVTWPHVHAHTLTHTHSITHTLYMHIYTHTCPCHQGTGFTLGPVSGSSL